LRKTANKYPHRRNTTAHAEKSTGSPTGNRYIPEDKLVNLSFHGNKYSIYIEREEKKSCADNYDFLINILIYMHTIYFYFI